VLPARHAVLALFLALSTALLALPAACGGGPSGETVATSSPAPAPAAGYRDSDDAPQDEQGRTGWRWKGKRQDCFYRYRNHCYDNLEAACTAARCGPSQCAHDGAAPSVVSCRK
jgi:hypothetical protein